MHKECFTNTETWKTKKKKKNFSGTKNKTIVRDEKDLTLEVGNEDKILST